MRQSENPEHERFYRLMAEQSPDVIIRYDLEGVIEYLSPAARSYGIDPDRAIGRNISVFVAPDERKRHEAFMAALGAGQPTPTGRQNIWRVEVPDGRTVAWEGVTCPMHEDGQVVGAMSVLRDVTERVALEDDLARQRADMDAAFSRLQESEARYRLLADYSADIIVQYDMDGIIQYVSPAVLRLMGYDPADLVGRRIGTVGETDPRQTIELLQNVQDGELPRGPNNEFEIARADGTRVWLQGNPTIVRDATGAPRGVVTQLRDVTERRKLEAQLEARSIEAEAAVAAKAEFLANMSREIRTPLTAVVGFAGLLGKVDGLPPKGRRYVDLIARGGEALTTIVNNVLDFSKIEAGQVQLKPEPAQPARLIRETMDVLEEEAGVKGLTLRAEGLERLPACVYVDAMRLRQVLLNLVANAVKFTHVGGVTVSASHDLVRDELRVEVRDTGIGIPADLSARLFQRFSQLESSNARRFGGTGLGLAISRALVQMMSGEIGVESREGEGARFWFTVGAPAIQDAPAKGEPWTEAPQLPPCRILVADDARPNRELIGALLSAYPVTVVEAANGIEAVAAARREPFDMILMDLQMPEMDGMAATRAIRRDAPLNRDTPILAVSASVLDSDVEACRAAGMVDHVPKPIDAGELIAKVARFCRPRAA